jgi:hypothetical protein
MDNIDHFLANLHFVGDGDFIFAVPLDTPADLQARLFAAWKSYGGGVMGMDEVLEKHGKAWNFDKEYRTELQVFVDEVVLPARAEVFAAVGRFSSAGKGRYPKAGQFAAGMALTRLNTTFTVLALLTRYGYGFEAAGVARLVLEQLAWAYAVRDGEDASLLEVMPQKSIGRLREILPWAGRLYGLLSEYAHIKPSLGGEYVEVSEEAVAVYSRRPINWSPMLAWCYALLADAFVVVAEIILPVDSPSAVRMEGGKAELLPDRPTARLLSKASPYAPFDLNNT